MGKKIDLTGVSQNYLTALYETGETKHGCRIWRCRCRCGKEISVRSDQFLAETTKSCGCWRAQYQREKHTKHGLTVSHCRLYTSVRAHFQKITNGEYKNWVIDPRYTNDAEGAVIFCNDLIALQPDMCERYETDKTLDLDKDNNDSNIFQPESIVFRESVENRGRTKHNVRLLSGARFVDLCQMVGEQAKSKTYKRWRQWFRRHNGEGHPELIKRANELIALYTKTLKLLQLLEDVRLLRACVQKSIPESRK